jgi:hypothetical protein
LAVSVDIIIAVLFEGDVEDSHDDLLGRSFNKEGGQFVSGERKGK